MPYFRVDDAFPSHPKVLSIPRKDRAAAVGLWTLAGAWCQHHLTDGRLAKHMVEELGSSKRYADHLVRAGLWADDGDAYVFHQFVGWQGASRDDRVAKREAEAERKRRWREAKAAKRTGQDATVPDPSQRDTVRTDIGTAASVTDASAPRPFLPSPAQPSPDVPYGDINEYSPREGDAAEADARATNDPLPDEPPLCRRHTGMDRDAVPPCAHCGRLRQQWETDRDAAHRPPPRPPWCGTCDQHTRLLDIDDRTVTYCPACHPRTAHLAGARP